ncbi:MAG TPA: response regulator [Mycobacteriales bacterium]|nr:response regulator [Mycobacteriales bacterium]
MTGACDTNVFQSEGEYWTVRYGSESCRLKDSKGLRYLASLLQSPGREFHVLELVTAATGGTSAPAGTRAGTDRVSLDADGMSVRDLGDSGDILDAQAKASYRRRLVELHEDLEEAEGFNDPVRASRARAEIDALEQQLSAAFGLGGRPRKAGSAAERARVNVRNSVASALKVISLHAPELAEHLKRAIRTGTFCWYVGDGKRWHTHGSDPSDGESIVEDVEERLLATLLFTDIVDSTKHAAECGDRAWRQLLDEHNAAARRQLARHGGRLVDSFGDGLFAVFDAPATAIACARGFQEELTALELPIRVGVHTGECSRRGTELSGISVHIAQRIMSQAEGGEILVSSTVREILSGSGIDLSDAGFHTLKGVPGTWRLFAVVGSERAGRRRPAHDGAGTTLSLMIVDDHPMWRQTLRTVLEGSGVGIVVAEASDGAEVVDLALAARPEAVVMDMNLVTVNGIEATRQLLAALPDTKVLMLSSSDERDDVVESVKAGASGYLLKTAGPDEVADAVQRIRAGELVFPPALAKVVLEEFRRMGRPKPRRAPR